MASLQGLPRVIEWAEFVSDLGAVQVCGEHNDGVGQHIGCVRTGKYVQPGVCVWGGEGELVSVCV